MHARWLIKLAGVMHSRPFLVVCLVNCLAASRSSSPSWRSCVTPCPAIILACWLLLVAQVPLTSALPFLEGALWGAGERRRTAALARNLRRSEQVTLLGELADVRSRWVLLLVVMVVVLASFDLVLATATARDGAGVAFKPAVLCEIKQVTVGRARVSADVIGPCPPLPPLVPAGAPC